VVCRCAWSRDLVNEEARAHWGLSRRKRERKRKREREREKIDIYSPALEVRAEMHLHFYQKWPIMLSDFQQNINVPTTFCRAANRKFNEHQSFTSRNVTCGQKDNIHKKNSRRNFATSSWRTIKRICDLAPF